MSDADDSGTSPGVPVLRRVVARAAEAPSDTVETPEQGFRREAATILDEVTRAAQAELEHRLHEAWTRSMARTPPSGR